MFRKLFLVVAALTMSPVWAQPPLPKPYGGGEYWVRNENTWVEWEVCSAELSGRQTPQWPEDDQEPEALLHIDWLIGRWPVVSKFSKGTVLQACPDPVGGTIWKDIDGASWLRVLRPEGGHCFVRANSKFIKPLKRETPVVSREVTPEPVPIEP